MDNRPIGIMDSGLGGITVLKELKKKIKNEKYIYLADTKNFPYGEKSKEEIIKYTRDNIKKLIERNVKIIIIACGTATSQALEIMQQEFSVPIIGIIEPTIDYISKLKLKKIGIIATTGTIKSGIWEKKILERNLDIKVFSQACPLLASIVEEGKAKSKESIDAIHKYMKIFKQNDIDTIVLGCTHYPIYRKIIKNEFEYDIKLINVGISIANNLEKFLNEKNLNNIGLVGKDYDIIVTKKIIGFEKKVHNILEKY